jgi:GT2 family glycosyltransferase
VAQLTIAQRLADSRRRLETSAVGQAPREGAWAERVTVIVKTFERPECVVRLLLSVREHYPSIGVLVCDDSRAPLYPGGTEPIQGVRWLTLDYERGHTLGAGRNHLVDTATTPYVFLMDDDHAVVPATQLPKLSDFLDRSGYDLVAGSQGRGDYGTAVFKRVGPIVLQWFYRHHGQVEPGVVRCDRVSNTFMAKTSSLRAVRWQEHVYAREHADFFLRASAAGLRIAQMGGVYVDHDRSCEPCSNALDVGRDHRDAHYRRERLGGRGTLHARALYAQHVLVKNQIAAIIDVALPWEKRALAELIERNSMGGAQR